MWFLRKSRLLVSGPADSIPRDGPRTGGDIDFSFLKKSPFASRHGQIRRNQEIAEKNSQDLQFSCR